MPSGECSSRGRGTSGNEERHVRELRAARTVTVTRLAPDPMTNPAREVLFTSNVLLTTPPAGRGHGALALPRPLRDAIATGRRRASSATGTTTRSRWVWSRRPTSCSTGCAASTRPSDAEPDAGRVDLPAVRSASRTTAWARSPARTWRRSSHAPAACATWTSSSSPRAIPAGWSTRSSSRPSRSAWASAAALAGRSTGCARSSAWTGSMAVTTASSRPSPGSGTSPSTLPCARPSRSTWTRCSPRRILVEETGRTAFGHLATPLWGATARDADGRDIELGMLAGALVNERDIGRGLFTPGCRSS